MNNLMNKIDMAGPWITESEESFVLDALRNGWYGKEAYKYVELFEFEFVSLLLKYLSFD